MGILKTLNGLNSSPHAGGFIICFLIITPDSWQRPQENIKCRVKADCLAVAPVTDTSLLAGKRICLSRDLLSRFHCTSSIFAQPKIEIIMGKIGYCSISDNLTWERNREFNLFFCHLTEANNKWLWVKKSELCVDNSSICKENYSHIWIMNMCSRT